MPMLNPKLRALQYLFFCKASGRVVAHCLNLDIVTAANDVDEAEKRLDLLVRKRIECALAVGNYAALNTTAPESYWTMFNDSIRSGRVRQSNNPTLMVRVPDVVPMDQSFSSIGVLAAMSA